MMTKKDYEVFAQILFNERYNLMNTNGSDEAINLIERIELGMMSYFNRDNPRFDAIKFMSAAAGCYDGV